MYGVTLDRHWTRKTSRGKGYWSGIIWYAHDEYGRGHGYGVRWTTSGNEVKIATTGHGGIGPDTAKRYATALTLAAETAADALTWPDGGE